MAVNGDIKPLNILMKTCKYKPAEIVLTDYGTCGDDELPKTKTGQLIVSHTQLTF